MIDKPLVFADMHHASLLYSFILLFEKRMGGQVFRPIGLEWAERGFWHVFDHPFTREQFLSTTLGIVEPPFQMYPDSTRPLNIIDKIEDGIYYCQDIDSGYYNKAITIDKFMSLPFDIVIASLPQHIEPFKKLCEIHPNHPKLIFQIGNAWSNYATSASNVMASAVVGVVPENINFITYHQEFDTNLFKPDLTTNPEKKIFSFINCFGIEGFFTKDWALFQEVEQRMPDWQFRSYGGQCRDGAAHGSKQLAEKIREARFIWHTKAGGDGYGHVLHNTFACGRPIIIKKSYYDGKLGGMLLRDKETCIDLSIRSLDEALTLVREISNSPERYAEMCDNVYNRFKKIVDFDKEFEDIKVFLNKLI